MHPFHMRRLGINTYNLHPHIPYFVSLTTVPISRWQLTSTPLSVQDTAPYWYLAYTHRHIGAALCYNEMHEPLYLQAKLYLICDLSRKLVRYTTIGIK